jgi:hypothetical protein
MQGVTTCWINMASKISSSPNLCMRLKVKTLLRVHRANMGDRLVVNVTNQLSTNTTSLHWHGLYQNGTNWYDGTIGQSSIPDYKSTVLTIHPRYHTVWHPCREFICLQFHLEPVRHILVPLSPRDAVRRRYHWSSDCPRSRGGQRSVSVRPRPHSPDPGLVPRL